MLAVLVVSCPCALSLATPAALSAAMANLRRRGLLIKATRALEIANRVDTAIFDKTGTLTQPQHQLVATRALGDLDAAWCLAAACALQVHSRHPLASAFRQPDPPQARDVTTHAGHGVAGALAGHAVRIGSADFCGIASAQRALSNKAVYLSVDGEPAARFDLRETVRSDAAHLLAKLKDQGVTSVLLSGDQAANCRRAGEALGIEAVGGQSPEDKLRFIGDRTAAAGLHGAAVLYVGDGMNDLPALARAPLSVATLEASDLVKARADALLLSTRLNGIEALLRIGPATHRIMRQNLAWAFGYNLLAIPIAASGQLTPWAAALGMSLSSLLVLLNAARLLRTPANGSEPSS